MSSILGIFGGSHDASATLIVDGKIVHCIEEERITRIKAGYNHDSIPELAIQSITDRTGYGFKNIDHISVATYPPEYFLMNNTNKEITLFNHHDCHGAAAYYTSGFQEKTMTIVLDGGGEKEFLKVYLCEDGIMNEVLKMDMSSHASIATLWAFITIGAKEPDENGRFVWNMCKDEGKLMGMAPNGHYDETVYRILRTVVNYKDLNFFPQGTHELARYVGEMLRRDGFHETDEYISVVAFNLQKLTEDLMLEFVNDLHNLHPTYRKICLAGGLFANVKLNQKINELDWIDEIYVLPPMGDNGLSLGAAILKTRELREGFEKPIQLNDVYFGLDYSDFEIHEVSKEFGFLRKPLDYTEIAVFLDSGDIIGLFNGKFEFGPRALGNRSILAKATDSRHHRILNDRLKRYDTMPFAPIIMGEYFDEVFTCGKSKYASEFMTLTFTPKPEWQLALPTVIQKSDKTARPQLVKKNKLPHLWNILSFYHKKTGIPVLLNTSFNAHNEPIINSPREAFVHLRDRIVDKLIMGNYLYVRPE